MTMPITFNERDRHCHNRGTYCVVLGADGVKHGNTNSPQCFHDCGLVGLHAGRGAEMTH